MVNENFTENEDESLPRNNPDTSATIGIRSLFKNNNKNLVFLEIWDTPPDGIAMPNESVQSDKALKAADTVIFVYSLLNRESWLQAKLAVSELPSSIRNIVFAGNFYDAIRNGSRTCNFSAELEIFVNEKNAMGTLPKFSFLSVSAKNGENIVALLNLSII